TAGRQGEGGGSRECGGGHCGADAHRAGSPSSVAREPTGRGNSTHPSLVPVSRATPYRSASARSRAVLCALGHGHVTRSETTRWAVFTDSPQMQDNRSGTQKVLRGVGSLIG